MTLDERAFKYKVEVVNKNVVIDGWLSKVSTKKIIKAGYERWKNETN